MAGRVTSQQEMPLTLSRGSRQLAAEFLTGVRREDGGGAPWAPPSQGPETGVAPRPCPRGGAGHRALCAGAGGGSSIPCGSHVCPCCSRLWDTAVNTAPTDLHGVEILAGFGHRDPQWWAAHAGAEASGWAESGSCLCWETRDLCSARFYIKSHHCLLCEPHVLG